MWVGVLKAQFDSEYEHKFFQLNQNKRLLVKYGCISYATKLFVQLEWPQEHQNQSIMVNNQVELHIAQFSLEDFFEIVDRAVNYFSDLDINELNHENQSTQLRHFGPTRTENRNRLCPLQILFNLSDYAQNCSKEIKSCESVTFKAKSLQSRQELMQKYNSLLQYFALHHDINFNITGVAGSNQTSFRDNFFDYYNQ
ncbi:hypothetical protein MRY82_02110 [bacterium]|nr:hypothetical protein [bacterium]